MCLQYPVQPFLDWSVVVKHPNNGVLLHLQKSFDINYFTVFVEPWLASVPCKYLGNFWMALLLDLGTEDGPSVYTKIRSTLTTVASY